MRSLRLLLLLLALPLPALAAPPPNVLFIYLDDLQAIRATTTPEL